MKRVIKKLLLLTVLMVAMALLLNWLGIQAGKVYKDGAALVCESKREMVRSGVVGHKKVPAEFDRLSGGRTYSYNLALPALPIGSSFFILKDYLSVHPPPQYIVLELYTNRFKEWNIFDYYAAQGMSGTSELSSLVKHMPRKSILLNYLFPFRMYKYHIPGYLFNRFFRPARIESQLKKNQAILTGILENRGYYFIAEQAVTEDLTRKQRGPGKAAPEYDPFSDPYVTLFFDLAERHNIRVLLIQPMYLPGKYQQALRIPAQFKAIMERYPNAKMAVEGWKLKFYEPGYFADPTHLKREGALRYTKEIYEEFAACFIPELSDSCGD
jgi:hypothetical protein